MRGKGHGNYRKFLMESIWSFDRFYRLFILEDLLSLRLELNHFIYFLLARILFAIYRVKTRLNLFLFYFQGLTI